LGKILNIFRGQCEKMGAMQKKSQFRPLNQTTIAIFRDQTTIAVFRAALDFPDFLDFLDFLDHSQNWEKDKTML
jgi:hypothetical protein